MVCWLVGWLAGWVIDLSDKFHIMLLHLRFRHKENDGLENRKNIGLFYCKGNVENTAVELKDTENTV